MRIPSLAEPRSAHKLEGLLGGGAVSEVEKGWELLQESDLIHGVGKAAAHIYARHGAAITCIDIDQALAVDCDSTVAMSSKPWQPSKFANV
jgi:hypothetical protein